MARPIKETPVLTGKDAAIFVERMKEQKDKRISKREKERIKANFDKLNSIAQF